MYISTIEGRSRHMAEVSTVEARAQFSEIINRAAFGKERMILTRRGKEIVAVVPIEDVRLLQALEDKIDLEEARAALAEAKKKGTVSWNKIKKDLGL
jgi:prevent-host-death family protein